MLDYDLEAPFYDETRGGQARAEAAAAALVALLPSGGPSTVVDVAGGTGIVAAALSTPGRRVVVLDRSIGMLRKAQERLPGREVAASALALPLRDGSVEAVTCVWLLHLLESAAQVEQVIAEAARVLRLGGRFVTTVDKNAAARARQGRPVTDRREDVEETAARHGLDLVGATTFIGHGQGQHGGADPVYQLVGFAKVGR